MNFQSEILYETAFKFQKVIWINSLIIVKFWKYPSLSTSSLPSLSILLSLHKNFDIIPLFIFWGQWADRTFFQLAENWMTSAIFFSSSELCYNSEEFQFVYWWSLHYCSQTLDRKFLKKKDLVGHLVLEGSAHGCLFHKQHLMLRE